MKQIPTIEGPNKPLVPTAHSLSRMGPRAIGAAAAQRQRWVSMSKKIALSVALAVSGIFSSASQAQDAGKAGELGYFIGYNAAIFELENGKSFCVPSSSLGSLAEAIRNEGSNIDPKKPAKGITRALLKAFPCEKVKNFQLSTFSSAEISRALLQTEISDQAVTDGKFKQSYSIGTLVAVGDLGEGESFCLAGSKNKISDVLGIHQQKHPTESFSAQFVYEAYKAGFPCGH